jgi:glycosyltransferase involved in cell wall biosynthesis
MVKASIIITTHNRPRLLPRAIQSAFTAGKDLEVVVVDDASSDKTAEVCKSFSDIKYVRLECNQGVAGARNVGLLESRGEYISFLDDDDTRLENSLDQQIEVLEREPSAGFIYARAFIDDDAHQSPNRFYPSECLTGDIFWPLLRRNFIPCGSVVFRRSILRAGMLDKNIPGIDDWDLWLRVAADLPVAALNTPVVTWRRSTPISRQGTSAAAEIVRLAVERFRNSWMNLPRAIHATSEERRSAWRGFSESMTEHMLCEAARAIRHGKPPQALENLFTIRRLDPLALVRIAKKRTPSILFNRTSRQRKPVMSSDSIETRAR